jgi:hypothetical protein
MFVSPINGHHGRVNGHRVRGHLPQARLGWQLYWRHCCVLRQRVPQQALCHWLHWFAG